MEFTGKTTVPLTSPSWLLAGWISISLTFFVINWSPRSLDLNPIEYLWNVLEQGVNSHHTAPTNLTELLTALAYIWQVIPVIRFQKLGKSIPRRVSAIIKYVVICTKKISGAVGSVGVRASDSRSEDLVSMPDATKYPLSTHGVRAC
ncbi:DDE_3 domain-containing protein [Trichonephila clavipes]|nr:DDE_3 domain-containing protein [Trichonephila clavipes]